MKKNMLQVLLFATLALQPYLSLKAQVYSEAPITISENGERLSSMIYVKFKPGDLIEIPNNRRDVDGNSISNEFPDIRRAIADFCRNWQLDLTDLRISKAIQNAREEDTLFTDVRTGKMKKLPNLARVFIIEFPKQVGIETIVSALSRFAEVEYAHGPVQLVNCAEYPNDQYYANGGQWYLNTISAPNAWAITKGSSAIKIALIEDSGVELTHDDLQSKIAGGDSNPAGVTGPHGTWVAGFAGAVTDNNNTGVASLGWDIELLTYQPNGSEPDREITAQKIKDAADAGAHVINLSFKTIKEGFTSCLELAKGNHNINSALDLNYYYNWDYDLIGEAISYAVGKNAVVVAAAGNTNGQLGPLGPQPCETIPYPCYPAQYSNVIAVSGSQQNNNFVDGWNYGSFVDVSAPGRTDASTGLWSTDLNDSYTNDVGKTSGTSFSTPQVSALAALIKSLNSSLTPSQIKTILENTADKVGQYSYSNGRNDYFGYGRINAYEALIYTLENYGGTLRGDITLTEDLTVPAGKTLTIEPGTTVKFASGVNLIVNGTLTADGSQQTITFTRDGASGNWGNIRFNSGSTGTIENAVIEYATKAIYSLSDAVTIEDCVIEDFTEQGIYASYSDMTIEDCIIRNPDGASHGIYLQFSNPTISETEIYGISGIGVYDYFGNTGTFTDGRIEDCTTGLQTYYSSMEVYNNYFEDNAYGVRFATNSDYVDIHDNDFIYNDYGLYLEQSEPNEVKWNQFGYSGTWKGNTYAGVLVNNLGPGNTFLSSKWNNFYDGDLYGKDIINNTGTTLNATGNYWLTEWTTGPVNTSSPQGSANTNAGPGGSLGKISRDNLAANSSPRLPQQFRLEQNYPNPFNPSTIITFHLPEEAKVNLVIYDVMGRIARSLAANSFYQPGIHQVNWDGRNDVGNALASGVYFYRLTAVPVSGGNSYSQSRKLVFIQ
jgi:subtilisin family serine protease